MGLYECSGFTKTTVNVSVTLMIKTAEETTLLVLIGRCVIRYRENIFSLLTKSVFHDSANGGSGGYKRVNFVSYCHSLVPKRYAKATLQIDVRFHSK